MTVVYERNHETEWLVLGQNPPAIADLVTVSVSGTAAWESGQVLGVVTATGKYVKYAPGASDGSQTAVAVLWSYQRAGAGDVRTGVLLHDGEVNAAKLIGLDAAARTSLTANRIVLREGSSSEAIVGYFEPGYVDAGYVAA